MAEEENQIKVIDCFAYCENKVLGKGSYGIVYQGYDTKQHLDIAVKKVSLKQMQKIDEKSAEFLRSEIKNMKVANHKYIVHLFDVRKSPNNLYLIVEYCNGVSLDYYLKQNGGRLSELESLEITRQVLQGYQALLEKKIIHRDLKPANILMHNGFVKLTDFGFSKAVEQTSDDPMFRTRVGSPLFMSPQILKGENYSVKTDIWSLGIQLYLLLYGKYPFMANDPASLEKVIRKQALSFPPKPKVNQRTKDVLKKMLVIKETDRISWEDLFQEEIFQEITDEEIQQMVKSTNQKYASNQVTRIYALNNLFFMLNRVIRNPFSCQEKLQKNFNMVVEGLQKYQTLVKLFSQKKELEYVDVGKIKEYKEKYNYLNPFFEAQDRKMVQRDSVQEIGFWTLQKRNKAIHVINIALQLYSLYNIDKKISVDEFTYLSLLFSLLKYALTQLYRLHKIHNFVLQQFQKKNYSDDSPKDQNLSEIDIQEESTPTKELLAYFPDEKWKTYAQTQEIEFILLLIRQDISIVKQFYGEIANIVSKYQPQGGSTLKDRQIKGKLQDLQKLCGGQQVDPQFVKNLMQSNVHEVIKKLAPPILSLGDNELAKKQEELLFLSFLISLTNLKKFLKHNTITEVDFNKYYESLEKQDIKELQKGLQEVM